MLMRTQPNYRNLEVYQMAFQLSLDMLQIASQMPMEAADTVSKALVKCSQTVGVKIAEGWVRRKRPGAMEDHMSDAASALAELNLWMMVGMEYNYISKLDYEAVNNSCDQLSNKLGEFQHRWVLSN